MLTQVKEGGTPSLDSLSLVILPHCRMQKLEMNPQFLHN